MEAKWQHTASYRLALQHWQAHSNSCGLVRHRLDANRALMYYTDAITNLSPSSENAQAIASGKHNVQDNCIIRRGGGSYQTFITVMAHINSITFGLQGFADERSGLLLVFNNQHAHA